MPPDSSMHIQNAGSQPQHLGPFRLLEPLSEQEHATLYRAVSDHSGTEAAVKLFHIVANGQDMATIFEAFFSDLRQIAAFSIPAMAEIFGFGEQDGLPFVAEALYDGPSLSSMTRRTALPPFEQATLWCRDLAMALHSAHSGGIAHGRIKPSEVILHDGRLVLVGFGEHVLLPLLPISEEQRQEESYYRAPECRVYQTATPRSDQFSLAAIYYQLLTGVPPFSRGPAPFTGQVLTRLKPPGRYNPALPAGVDALCSRALSRDPAERFANCAALAEAFDGLIRGSASARPASVAVPSLTQELEPVEDATLRTQLVNRTSGTTSLPVKPAAPPPPAQPPHDFDPDLAALIQANQLGVVPRAPDAPRRLYARLTNPSHRHWRYLILGIGLGILPEAFHGESAKIAAVSPAVPAPTGLPLTNDPGPFDSIQGYSLEEVRQEADRVLQRMDVPDAGFASRAQTAPTIDPAAAVAYTPVPGMAQGYGTGNTPPGSLSLASQALNNHVHTPPVSIVAGQPIELRILAPLRIRALRIMVRPAGTTDFVVSSMTPRGAGSWAITLDPVQHVPYIEYVFEGDDGTNVERFPSNAIYKVRVVDPPSAPQGLPDMSPPPPVAESPAPGSR